MSARLIFVVVIATAMLVPFSGKIAFGQWTSPRRSVPGETVAGGIAGAIIGGIVGKQNDETPEGIAIGAAVGALAGNAFGNSRQQMQQEQYAYQQRLYQQQAAQQQAFQRAATIEDVISMSQNGIGSAVIENHLQSVGMQQEVGVSEIITLHRAGVDERVIKLMQEIGSGQPAAVVRQTDTAPVSATTPRFIVEQRYAVPAPIQIRYSHPRPYHSRRHCDAYHGHPSHRNFPYHR
jgi:hypothetical protein